MTQPSASSFTSQANKAALESMPFTDVRDFEDASHGFLGTISPAIINNASGGVVWDAASYDFLTGDAPDTVHPSLWRQSRLTAMHGLFEVVEGIYQVRGFDLSNVTFVEGDTGVIVIDPLISKETAAAAWSLYREHRGDRQVTAVIYTHSHVDHFGGVRGIVDQADVDSGAVIVVAPEGFIDHVVAENVYAGTAMTRRAAYMYGAALSRGPAGQLGAGLGQTTSTGEVTVILPTKTITTTGESLTIDGVEIVFQMAPGTEAPSEMHFYFPRYKALCMAENATHTQHNLLTLRGALVRDPHVWSQYLTEAIETFGSTADVVFTSHHWPTWGRERIIDFLSIQRDMYGYLHDQTLRLLNKGYTGAEIAERMQLPPALEAAWSTHGYYGSISHNVKAIYQRYMGWFDGNPARLWQHTPGDAASRYVAAMGGIDSVIGQARTAFDSGDYRWAATLLDHAIFAEPDNADASALLADTLEQLGFGSENGTWRNFFLSGATELRSGNFGTPVAANSHDMLDQLTVEQFFDVVAIQINGPKAWDLNVALDWTFTDSGENYRVTLNNGVLIYVKRAAAVDADATIALTRAVIPALATGSLDDARSAGMTVTGNEAALMSILSMLDPGDPGFNIVTPRLTLP
ncbi:alkyl/aryl-sulfatase [Leifsonia sp. A12D58]|uniref:alkyl/aryl-sulfatase n=1 Tax=Leifsonia sp. A12D58 TaxID=3397674 RepID=UPI0039E1BECB